MAHWLHKKKGFIMGVLAGLASKYGGEVIGGAIDAWGNKLKADRYRSGIKKQISAEEEARRQGEGYYSMLEGEYAPEAGTYMSDLASMRDAESQAPRELGEFDNSQFAVQNFQDPSAQYQQDQMRRVVDQSAANRGGLFSGSGSQARELQNRGSLLAQGDFANSSNRAVDAENRAYARFTDKYRSGVASDAERLNRLQSTLSRSGSARGALLDSRGANADLGMSSSRAIGDMRAQKDQITGDLYGSFAGIGSGLARSAGNMGSTYFGGKK